MNDNYPVGADTPNAPWNQEDLPEREFEVTVSITLSKTIKITTSDYTLERDESEDGIYEETKITEDQLQTAVREQVFLPYEAGDLIRDFDIGTRLANQAAEDLSNWDIDDFEIVQE